MGTLCPVRAGEFGFWLAVAFFGGIYSFFKGFRVYRGHRVVEVTPEIPVRIIPMGLAYFHGKAKGNELVESPVSHTACYFYKVDSEKWKAGLGRGGSWTMAPAPLSPAFFLIVGMM